MQRIPLYIDHSKKLQKLFQNDFGKANQFCDVK